MEFHFFNSSTVYRNLKENRVQKFIRISAYIMLCLSIVWAILTIIQGLYFLTYLILVPLIFSIIVLMLIKYNQILAAKFIMLLISFFISPQLFFLRQVMELMIIQQFISGFSSFADEFHDCSVLFADIAGFTTWAQGHSPNEVVDFLNDIFSRFDDEVDSLNLTKIKTSGDSYMVAAGIPEMQKDHALLIVKLAFRFLKIAEEFNYFKFRIGINSGTVVAGVIGKKTFIYDLWGDTVNTASRMESSGEAGKINISGSTFDLIKDSYKCFYRGKIEAKDKGLIEMYFIEPNQNS